MITPDAAWGIVLEHVRPLKPAAVPLTDALGCCLAEDVRADRDLPPADRSARDGYAVRHDDLQQRPCVLRVIGEVAAGSPGRPRVKPGACARIFTGANIPPGADTVVMVEQTQEDDGLVTISSSVARGANILRQGEDAPRGTVLLPRGTQTRRRRGRRLRGCRQGLRQGASPAPCHGVMHGLGAAVRLGSRALARDPELEWSGSVRGAGGVGISGRAVRPGGGPAGGPAGRAAPRAEAL